MIDYGEAKRFIAAMPWPEGAIKPRIGVFATDGDAWCVLLHKPINRGWTDIARITGPTPEGALRFALEKWLTTMKLSDRPELFDAIKRLTN